MNFLKKFRKALADIETNGKPTTDTNELKTEMSKALWALDDEEMVMFVLFVVKGNQVAERLAAIKKMEKIIDDSMDKALGQLDDLIKQKKAEESGTVTGRSENDGSHIEEQAKATNPFLMGRLNR